MNIKKFELKEDYNRVIKFLTDQYNANKNMECWLPERFDDLIYRVDVLYHDERGKERSADYIYIFEDDSQNILGIIIPDGDSFNTCIKNGNEKIFEDMLEFGERNLKPLFDKEEDGTINFLVISHDSLKYQAELLASKGYKKDLAEDYDNVQYPLETNYVIELPKGYRQVYGEKLEDMHKYTACHFGFHPEDDDNNLNLPPREGKFAYYGRKDSQFYKDSFESLIVTEDNDICSYCFCYVDRNTSTAFIEPVSTREKYRHKGFAKQMLYGVINRLKEMGIEKVFINSYDWRVKVYNSAGFETIGSIGFWQKKIK